MKLKSSKHNWPCRALWVCGWLVTLLLTHQAEQLPIKTYTAADGLARDSINRIVRDSRGFLWFCTPEGLSRFDGYKFTNYTIEQGLPHRSVRDVLETRSGVYWVATADGLCRFNPRGSANVANPKNGGQAAEPMFVVYRPGEEGPARNINTLIEDHTGTIWCGTQGGLYRLASASDGIKFQLVELGMPKENINDLVVESMLEDRHGALWIGTGGSSLYRRLPDGRVERYTTRHGIPASGVKALLEDRGGQLWAATTNGLCQIVADPAPNKPLVRHVYTTQDGLPSNWIHALFQSSDGRLWIGSDGLSELIFTAKEGEQRFRTYTQAHGLSDLAILALTEDRQGNLWIGTESGGAMKLARSGFTTYSEADGLGHNRISSIYENQAGELCVDDSRHFLNRFDGNRFIAVKPNFPRQIISLGWGWLQLTLQDRAGEWWVPTGQGLCRFPMVSRVEQLAHTPPLAVYTTKDGLMTDNIFRLFEDSRGDIWISSVSVGDSIVAGLSRWERATGSLHSFSEADGLLSNPWATAFCEDHSGNIWIGEGSTGLFRYRAGRFTNVSTADGLPANGIEGLYLDHAGRLWVATGTGGLSRIDDPPAEHPRFITYTTADGLSSNQVRCVTEDRWGNIYLGTGRGVDRLNPVSGKIKHYTAADGLARGPVYLAFRDRHDVLWFGTAQGISRLAPETDPPQQPPPILISGWRVTGVPRHVSELGETEVPRLTLGPQENQVSIDFVGLDFGPGAVLRYQFKLEDADRDWNAPTLERAVNYPNLPPGAYRFLVRAINAEGAASDPPASLSFTIERPVWQRWWFLALMMSLAGGLGFAAYHYRVAQLLAMERVRTRIAADLHDDIGANLTKIAILSEVAKQQYVPEDQSHNGPLSAIASISRESVAAMSDIVWAINPKKDSLLDLTRRMRQFAEETLVAREIALEFHAPDAVHGGGQELKLGVDVRRQMYLIFKESLNNIVRHAEAERVEIELRIEGRWLALRIADDGKGFDTAQEYDGNGLLSIKKRAVSFSGELRIDSHAGRGTTVWLRTPWAQKNWLTLRK